MELDSDSPVSLFDCIGKNIEVTGNETPESECQEPFVYNMYEEMVGHLNLDRATIESEKYCCPREWNHYRTARIHEKAITCISATKNNSSIVITGSDDGLVKVTNFTTI